MASKTLITNAMIEESAIRSIENVFHTMLHEEIRYAQRVDDSEVSHGTEASEVMGCVGFAGEINGLVYLRFSKSFALHATTKVLGLAEQDVIDAGPEVISDAVGELANMAAGGFKNVFCDLGHPCMLTLPTVVSGDHLAVTTVKDASRHVFRFESLGQRVIVDVQMKGGQH
jgi:chemotaxis protein CheX